MFWGGIKSYKQQNKAKLMDSEMGNYLKNIFDGFKFYGWANPGRLKMIAPLTTLISKQPLSLSVDVHSMVVLFFSSLV